MKRVAMLAWLAIACTMLIVGLVFVFTAPTIGQNAGHREIMRQGGSMDTHQFERVISASTTAFTVGGAVISLIGGSGVLVSGYLVIKELN